MKTRALSRAALPTARQLYAYAQVLSLDVAAGALASAALPLYLLGRSMPGAFYVVLPLAVWCIYTADHLLDARRLGAAALTPRHRFHHNHFGALLAVWIGALGLCLGLALARLPADVIQFGLVMGALCLLHFGIIQLLGRRPGGHKELAVGAIYAAGVWGGPLIVHAATAQAVHYVMAAQFFLVAMLNLLAFARYEREGDAKDGQPSLARAIGDRGVVLAVRGAVTALVILAALVASARAELRFLWAELVILVMGGLLLWIAERPAAFAVDGRYRLLGDAVFIVPGLFYVVW